jgi:hypothetical protein
VVTALLYHVTGDNHKDDISETVCTAQDVSMSDNDNQEVSILREQFSNAVV